MSESKSNQNVVALSKSTALSNIRQPRRRMAQNYILLWVDTSIDQTNEDYETTLKQIRSVTSDVNAFTQRDACIDFLTDAEEDVKSFLIVKDTMFQQIMPLINDIPQLDGVYIFNDIKTLHEQWTKKFDKIKSIHTIVDDLCQALQIGIKQVNRDSIAMSFITKSGMGPIENLNQLEPTFMYTQLFKEILLDMQHGEQAIKDFITYCRDHDCMSPKYIDRFEKEYSSQSAIWWYTFPSNIYSMLNYALRSMEADTIINMGFFIHDLHQQIQQLHQQQINSYHGKSFIVYRGQGLSKTNFENLRKAQGGLVSFNNFLSTSTEQDIALGLAYSASENVDMAGILFIMSIDPSIISAPFASIKERSYFKEEDEILFSMHTVFQVVAIKQMDNENQLYQVELQLTSDDDQQLRLLTDRIREEAGDGTGWRRLGNLLITIGQFNKAEELYNVLLEQTSDEHEKAIYYGCLGYTKDYQGDYEKAIWYNKRSLEIYQKTLPSDHHSLANLHNNIGCVYNAMGENLKALSFHETAIEIREKTLPSNHPFLASSYGNIGNVYNHMREYSKALSFYEKAIEIHQTILPSNHPSLTTSYNNIGVVYSQMGEYSKALSFFEKALETFQKTLPSNHPDLASSYSSIGSVYHYMGEYSKALSFHEKAIETFQKTLPCNHPSLAISYNNIGVIYSQIGEYLKALPYLEKVFEIRQEILPENHPDLTTSYNSIGDAYSQIGHYSRALSLYKKALEIRQKTLPSNHPDFAQSYNRIGTMYENMRECSKALPFYEKAIGVHQETLPSNHPSLTTSYNNIGMVYSQIGEYEKALSFFEKALETFQKTLPSNHPDLAALCNNIGFVYKFMKDYSKALSYFERALDIWQRVLPPAHPNIHDVKESIEIVKKETIKNG
ncbi:unnamed protein product [Adineta steineri]|uniref:NAD(P)(+)--arginine ADP-ribosyltransferase n=1 Tax=Adineta steineri TaxID=433720 RepID=A0A815IQ95_9BILA|nr:unnamed protein product [Adineta steineri]CAF1481292.1 unnamed protein product [Adineta steineri]